MVRFAVDPTLPTARANAARSHVRMIAVRYAKKNLCDVQDMAIQHDLSEIQAARFARADLGAEQTGMNYLIVKPGQREAFAHRHRTADMLTRVAMFP